MVSDPAARFTRAVLLAALVILPALPAHAQPVDDRASARALAAEADRQLAAGDVTGAIDSFTKAYGYVPAPTLKVARAHAYLKLGRLIEAQEDLLDAARSEAKPGEPRQFTEARDKAFAEAQEITPRLPLVTLAITGATTDRLTVTVDGQRVLSTRLDAPRAMNPGAHTIRVEAEGFGPSEQQVTLVEGEQKTVSFALAPPGVSITSPPPPGEPAAAPMAAPAMGTPPPRERPPDNTVSTLGWIGTGLFAGTGAVTGILAIVQANQVKSKCNGNACPSSVQGEASSSSTLGNVSTGTFAVAAGCLLLAILTHHSASTPAPAHAAHLTVTLEGVGVSGAF
jgi:hypothetical protein